VSAVEQVWTKVRSLGIVPEANVYRSLGADSPEERPFIVVQNAPGAVAFGTVGTRVIQVWMYDTSYTRIDPALTTIRDALLADTTLGDVVWEGTSEDLYDDKFRCATRYAAFLLPNSDG
jgi:hypothetical protein